MILVIFVFEEYGGFYRERFCFFLFVDCCLVGYFDDNIWVLVIKENYNTFKLEIVRFSRVYRIEI